MSAPINTGGPAFPTDNARQIGSDSWHEEGMTLRDYFAAKAMPVVAAEIYAWKAKVEGDTVPGLTAKLSYQFADAMLKAREA